MTISLETILAANPEVMIAGVNHVNVADSNFQFIKFDPRLENIDARQNNLVYAVDSNLSSRPRPRIVDALEQFAALIHPELFGQFTKGY